MNKNKNDILTDIITKGDLHFQRFNKDEILVTIPHSTSNKKELHINIKTAVGGWDIHIFERTDDSDFDLIFEFVNKTELEENIYLKLIFDNLSSTIEDKLGSFTRDELLS